MDSSFVCGNQPESQVILSDLSSGGFLSKKTDGEKKTSDSGQNNSIFCSDEDDNIDNNSGTF